MKRYTSFAGLKKADNPAPGAPLMAPEAEESIIAFFALLRKSLKENAKPAGKKDA